ncbi:MAG: hypothetical protein CMJ72_14480 [Planctomycetaceae bacterium]|nr:hypothetical protein [Planctomycetaceae bacterium]
MPMRLWMAAPDWMFRVAGATFFFVYFLSQAQKYWDSTFWNYVPYFEWNNHIVDMPWVPVLVDITFLQIAVAFCFRIQARMRASDGWTILYTMFTAFAPLIPVWIGPILGLWNIHWQQSYNAFLWREVYSWQLALALGVIQTTGFLIEIWCYAVLFRSLSIVPEARELKVTGPYRLVRHPIYLGQFIAMAGFLLIIAKTHWVWISLYIIFVAMQLYRSKLEDRVLAEAFGEPYCQWQKRTFWFV